MPAYTPETIAECFPHKSDDWVLRTADDLNSVHRHVDDLEAQGLSAESAWLETIQLMRTQRSARG